MPPEDLTELRRMLDAARMALEFSQGRSRTDLESQTMYRFAVVKAVELVGEAANKVTAASKSELSNIPWRDITGMRNILVHDFHNIDNDIFWNVIRVEMPRITARLEIVLATRNG